MEDKNDLNMLVNRVIESGDRTAIKKLGKAGTAGVEAALKGMNGPYPTERHPIDIMDDFGAVFAECAKFNTEGLKEVIEKDEISPDPEMVLIVSALESSPKKEQVVKILTPVLKHSNQEVRWVAAKVMIKIREKSTIEPLTESLRDRSFFVKSTIVGAMKKDSFFRNQKAIKYLEKITLNKTIKKHDPHLCKDAQKVIELIKAGPDNKDQHSIPQLIDEVIRDADKQSEIKLASFGYEAVLAITDAMSKIDFSQKNWGEAMDNLNSVLKEIAKNDPKPIIEVIEKNEVPADPHLSALIFALQVADDKDSIADTLILTLRHQDESVRHSSAKMLMWLETEKSVGPLIQALADKSQLVKQAIVHSMKSNSFLRRLEAIKSLERIIASDREKEWYDRVGETTQEVLSLIKKEQSNR